MAIAYASYQQGGTWSSTSLGGGIYRFDNTLTWGSGPTTFIFIEIPAVGTITSATLGGSSLELVRSGTIRSAADRKVYVYVTTLTSATLQFYADNVLAGGVVSYQSTYTADTQGADLVESSAIQVTTGDPAVGTLTTISETAWLTTYVEGNVVGAGSGTTERVNVGGSRGIYDSNGTLTPGSNSLNIDTSGPSSEVSFAILALAEKQHIPAQTVVFF